MQVTCAHEPARIFSGLLRKADQPPVIEHERATVKRLRSQMRRGLRAHFKAEAARVAVQLADSLELQKDDRTFRERAMAALDQIELDWSGLVAELTEWLVGVAVDGGGQALESLGIADGEAAGVMRLRAEAWARQRAAELVGMRVLPNGQVVPNQNAAWRIDEPTRAMLLQQVETAIAEGWSTKRLGKELVASHAFSESRADMIARTEIARADIEGTINGWEATGLVAGKEWLTAADCCPICDALNGVVVPLRSTFPGGVQGPPKHPRCRCRLLSVFAENMPSSAAN